MTNLRSNAALALSGIALVFTGSSAALAADHYVITSKGQIAPKVYKSLKGKQGKRGKTGARGAVGPTGAQGIAGKAGAVGQTGAQGPRGLTGAQGPAGPSGASDGLKAVTGTVSVTEDANGNVTGCSGSGSGYSAAIAQVALGGDTTFPECEVTVSGFTSLPVTAGTFGGATQTASGYAYIVSGTMSQTDNVPITAIGK